MHFNKNQEITDINNVSYKILDLLGEGGQGEVYLVMDDENNQYALKIYKNKVNEEFLLNLEHNTEKGTPSKEFVWPKQRRWSNWLFNGH